MSLQQHGSTHTNTGTLSIYLKKEDHLFSAKIPLFLLSGSRGKRCVGVIAVNGLPVS